MRWSYLDTTTKAFKPTFLLQLWTLSIAVHRRLVYSERSTIHHACNGCCCCLSSFCQCAEALLYMVPVYLGIQHPVGIVLWKQIWLHRFLIIETLSNAVNWLVLVYTFDIDKPRMRTVQEYNDRYQQEKAMDWHTRFLAPLMFYTAVLVATDTIIRISWSSCGDSEVVVQVVLVLPIHKDATNPAVWRNTGLMCLCIRVTQ